MSEKAERVRALIAEHLCAEPDKVVDDARIEEDLGGDSLDRVELVMAVEEEFGFEVRDDVADGLVKVGNYVDLVEQNAAK